MSKSGESYQFGIPEGKIAEFLQKRGFELVKQFEPKDLEKDYLTDKQGKLYGKICEHQCIVLAEVA